MAEFITFDSEDRHPRKDLTGKEGEVGWGDDGEGLLSTKRVIFLLVGGWGRWEERRMPACVKGQGWWRVAAET